MPERIYAAYRAPEGQYIFKDLLSRVRLPICLTDPRQPDNPIVYANPAFLELTGYSFDEVIGRNCRFLQGPRTTRESVEKLRQMIADKTHETVQIVNYRKDGSEFLNSLQIGPIIDPCGETVLFFGSQFDVTEQRRLENEHAELQMRELSHRLRNVVNVMSGIIRIGAREASDVGEFAETLIGRLHALSEAHFRSIEPGDGTGYTVADLSRSILSVYAPAGLAQIQVAGPDLAVPRTQLTVLSLTLHELATNAVKHGALSAPGGMVSLNWNAALNGAGPETHFRWRERGGPPVAPPIRSSGSDIIRALVREASGKLEYDWRADGLNVTFNLPQEA